MGSLFFWLRILFTMSNLSEHFFLNEALQYCYHPIDGHWSSTAKHKLKLQKIIMESRHFTKSLRICPIDWNMKHMCKFCEALIWLVHCRLDPIFLSQRQPNRNISNDCQSDLWTNRRKNKNSRKSLLRWNPDGIVYFLNLIMLFPYIISYNYMT